MEWQARNRARSNAIKRRWAQAYPDKDHAAKIAYSRSERGKQNKREYKASRREHVNEQARQSYAFDPAKFRERLARREAREANAEGRFTREDLDAMFERQGGKCANPACGCDLHTIKYHADHILALIHGGTHWADNRQLLCYRCNHIKGVRRPEEWFAMIADVQLFKRKWGLTEVR